MTSVTRYFPIPLTLFVERVIFRFVISNMVLVPIFSVNCRRQRSLGPTYSDLPRQIRSRYQFSLKPSISVGWGWGVWAWSLVVGTIIFVFLLPSLVSVLIFVENRAFLYDVIASGQTDRNSKWPPALTKT